MKDLNLTVTGWVATDPRYVITRDGEGPPMCTFRLAQSSRYFDRAKNEWADRKTEWFTVRVFRDAARLIAESIRTGQPVIVQGRLRTNEWTDSQDIAHWGLEIDATCVGHDLTKGIGSFTRATVTGGEEEADSDEVVEDAEDGLDTAGDVDDDMDSEDVENEEVGGRPAALV